MKIALLILIALLIGCGAKAPSKFKVGETACLKSVGGEFLITWITNTSDGWWYTAHSSKGQRIDIRERFIAKCPK